MEETLETIVVDGKAFHVRFRGFHEPMVVDRADGRVVTLLPWTYCDHMNALRQSLVPTAYGFNLDADQFCRLVLRRCAPTADCLDDMNGLFLWWAGGGEAESAEFDTKGWLELGPVRVRLRGWSHGDRLNAISRNLINDDTGDTFDVVGYLDAMVRSSIAAMDPLMNPDELDPVATTILIRAVLDLNAPENPLPKILFDEGFEAGRNHACTTLKLCACLGWTPSKVWAAPAAEVDRLLTLIDLVEPAPTAQSLCFSRLADYPDAVVIHFEDD